jgi:hypothetical protein
MVLLPLADRLASFLIDGLIARDFSFVVKFSASSQPELALETAILQVNPQRNECKALFRGASDEFSDLTAVQQELSGAERIVIGVVSVGVRADVTIQQPDFSALDQAISVFEVHTAVPGGLDFRTGKDHAGLKSFENLVIVEGLPIDGDLFVHRIVPGIAPGVPGTAPGPEGCGGDGCDGDG